MQNIVNLSDFIHRWEEALKKPEDIFLSETIGNISEYFLYTTKPAIIRNNTFQMNLFNIIQERIRTNTVESKIISSCAPATIRTLSQPVGNQIHLASIQKQCKRILKAYSNVTFVKQIRKFISANLINPDNKIDLALFYLLRSLLLRYSVKHLKDLPKDIFANEFFALKRKSVSRQARKNGLINQKMDDMMKGLLTEINTVVKTLNAKTTITDSLHFGNIYWEREVDYFVHDSKDLLRTNRAVQKVIKEIKICSSVTAASKILDNEDFSKLTANITKKCVDRISTYIVIKCLEKYHSTNALSELSKNDFCVQMSNLIKKITYENYEVSKYSNFYYSVADSMVWTFIMIFSKFITTKLESELLEKQQKLLKIILAKYFFEKINNEKITKITQGHYLVDRFSMYLILNEFMMNMAKKMIHNIFETIINTDNNELINNTKSKTFNILLEKIYKKIAKWSISSIPANLSLKTARQLINALFDELSKPDKRYRLFCIIGDLDCNGRSFPLGDSVVFFDARTWEFGEGTKFDLFYESAMTLGEKLKTTFNTPYAIFSERDRTYEMKRNSGRAYVEILAADRYMAIDRAVTMIRESLDTLVFASSAYGDRGFKPQIPSDFFILDADKRFSLKTSSRHPLASDSLVLSEDYDRITSYYNKLKNNASKHFDDSILNALHWYHVGHWELLPHLKFVAHWIALEQLINKEHDSTYILKPITEYVPRLTVTWRTTSIAWVVSQYLKGIILKIKKNSRFQEILKNNTKLRDWDKNNGIILGNLKELLLISSGEINSATMALKSYLTRKKIAYIKDEIKILRKDLVLKLYFLYSRRNSLVHEGSTFSAQLYLMSKFLEKLLSETLISLLEFRDKKKIEQIIYERNRPYNVK